MQIDFPLKIKASDAGLFEGLASTYGNVDMGRDLVERGAFTETLTKRGAEIPILWSHDQANPVGLGQLADSPEGLRIAGSLDLDTVSGREAYSRVRKRIVKGLSIGFQVPENGAAMEGGIRRLKRIELYEVSLVTLPMNTYARVTHVKSSIATVRDFEAMLRESGYSKSEATRIASHGYVKGLGMPSEPEADPLELQLAEWLREQAALRQ